MQITTTIMSFEEGTDMKQMSRWYVMWNTGRYSRTGKPIVDMYETDDRERAGRKVCQLEQAGFDGIAVSEEQF